MKLVGYVDGIEISFNFCPPNIYEAVIPKRLNGKYIVQLKAIDDAGNETNMADTYMYMDFQQMIFKNLGNKFRFNIDDSKFGFKEVSNQYSHKELMIK